MHLASWKGKASSSRKKPSKAVEDHFSPERKLSRNEKLKTTPKP
jgi:hypothetical protein